MVPYPRWRSFASGNTVRRVQIPPAVKNVGLLLLIIVLQSASLVNAAAEPPDAIAIALDQAQRSLAANTALEARTASALEALKQDTNPPAAVVSDYEAYLAGVRAMVAENRRLVQQLEALQAQHAGRTSPSQANTLKAVNEAPIPETAVGDSVADLDRELDASLAEFDDLLLEELKLIREQSAPKMESLAQEANAAAERLRQKGIDIDADSSEAQTDVAASRQQAPPKARSQEAAAAAGTERDAGSPATSGGHTAEGGSQAAGERYDGSDDDIVARQLREAAEQETDPVLKEKLWREYEAYKRGGQ
jgi:hypothetical protein